MQPFCKHVAADGMKKSYPIGTRSIIVVKVMQCHSDLPNEFAHKHPEATYLSWGTWDATLTDTLWAVARPP